MSQSVVREHMSSNRPHSECIHSFSSSPGRKVDQVPNSVLLDRFLAMSKQLSYWVSEPCAQFFRTKNSHSGHSWAHTLSSVHMRSTWCFLGNVKLSAFTFPTMLASLEMVTPPNTLVNMKVGKVHIDYQWRLRLNIWGSAIRRKQYHMDWTTHNMFLSVSFRYH